MTLSIRAGRILDTESGTIGDPVDLLLADGRIQQIGSAVPATDQVIDASGRVVMAGLIDGHTHLVGYAPIHTSQRTRPDYLALRAAARAGRLLRRGFTSIRDMGGASVALAAARDEGLFGGPRLFWCGKGLSQTGGHGEFADPLVPDCGCTHQINNITDIVDGADAVLAAARTQLGQGAHHVKVFAGGGAASPTDPLEGVQYLLEELRAAVRAAQDFGRYVAAHAIAPAAVERCVEAGVRTIEHGNLIDAPTAALCADRGVFVVPTMTIYNRMVAAADEMDLANYAREKSDLALTRAFEALDHLRTADARVGFGTDMVFSPWDDHLMDELTLRREVYSPAEILHQATVVNAEIIERSGELGIVAEGATADLLIVDGDPLDDLEVLRDERRLLVIQEGRPVTAP